jgi:mannan endo-1,4-beta-mannosidase
MKYVVFIFCASFLATYVPETVAVEPVDSHLIPEARKVLNYLESVYGKKTLSGMASYGGWRPVFEICGRAPAIYSTDAFGWNKPKFGRSYVRVMKSAIETSHNWWHEKGGIVAMQFHWGKPGDPNGSAWVSGGKGTGPVDMAKTVIPGTPEHKAAMDDLRQTADYLEQLARARVPVLWRPLHEIDGGWFWWTDVEQPENTAALWRMMFDYLVKDRELHNLIWVYSAGLKPGNLRRGTPLDEEIAYRKRFYPGDRYVDIAGIDIYPNSYYGWESFTDDTYGRAFELMKRVAPGKMLALCESAAIPNPDILQREGPPWLYCLPWFAGDRRNSPEWIRKTFPHDHILTLDELPQLVPHNTAPNVRLLQPRDGAEIAGSTVQLRALAGDRDNNLKDVAFYLLRPPWKNWFLRDADDMQKALANGTRLGDADVAPDGAALSVWANASAGFHDVVAVARDAEGAVSMSNVARIVVGLHNLAQHAKVQASSDSERASHAVDGDLFSSWSGDKKGEQWLSVDLGSEQTIGGVVVAWWKAYARSFRIQVSLDGTNWRDVFQESNKTIWHGDSDVIRFEPQRTRHVRLVCDKPGTDWGGYVVYELAIFASIPE